MDSQVSGSFIPKKPLVETSRRGGGMGLLLLGATLLFIVSLLAAAGVFAYHGILKASISSKDNSLKRAEGAFEPAVIEELSRLDARLIRARDLLTKHTAPSGIFDFLSTLTLERVQFTSFSFELGAAGGAAITLTGVADSFSSVALQSDQFGANRLLKDVVFSDVGVGQGGKVSFNVKAAVDPALYLYVRQSASTEALPVSGGTQTPATTTESATQTP